MSTLHSVHADLDEIVDVWHQSIHSHFNQHHQSSTDVLPHVRVLVTRQVKQVLMKHNTTIHSKSMNFT